MYDPISGRGKIPAPDYSAEPWYQKWRAECRSADKYIDCEYSRSELSLSMRGRRALYAPTEERKRTRAYDRARKKRAREARRKREAAHA